MILLSTFHIDFYTLVLFQCSTTFQQYSYSIKPNIHFIFAKCPLNLKPQLKKELANLHNLSYLNLSVHKHRAMITSLCLHYLYRKEHLGLREHLGDKHFM